MYQLNSIKEVIYSVGNMERTLQFFVEYGNWDVVGNYKTSQDVLEYWNLDKGASAEEYLLDVHGHPTGQIRLVKYNGVHQQLIRSAQNPWDVGGIMDINLRVHDVPESYEELREMGWHGLSNPLFQEMGPFKLHDVLMKGYDDIIVAFTHTVQPPLNLTPGLKLPTHVYNSSIIARDMELSLAFYKDILDFQLLTEYEVKKDAPQENMFGLPFNLADQVTCRGKMFSLDGTRDVIFQIIDFEGLTGNDYSRLAIPPNIGWMLYRCSVTGLQDYYNTVRKRGGSISKELQPLDIAPYGKVNCFSIVDPNGVIWEFFEEVS